MVVNNVSAGGKVRSLTLDGWLHREDASLLMGDGKGCCPGNQFPWLASLFCCKCGPCAQVDLFVFLGRRPLLFLVDCHCHGVAMSASGKMTIEMFNTTE